MSTIIKKYYKSSYPDLNAKNHDEFVALFTIYSDNLVVNSGCKQAQFFVGNKNNVHRYIRTGSQFINTLEDYISDRGSMFQLVSNTVQTKISKRVPDMQHALIIGDWQSGLHQQHQNPAEQ